MDLWFIVLLFVYTIAVNGSLGYIPYCPLQSRRAADIVKYVWTEVIKVTL